MNRECPFCGSGQARFCFEATDTVGGLHGFHACSNCQTLYLHPRPDTALLAEAYSRDYYGQGQSKFQGLIPRGLGMLRQRLAKRLSRKLHGKGSILDIGCGDGTFLAAMDRCGDFELHGTELEEAPCRFPKTSQVIHLHRVGPKCDFPPMRETSFDLISLFHVWEHLPQPSRMLEQLSNLSPPGGLVVIAIPNSDSWEAHLFKRHWFHLDPPRHLCLVGREALLARMEALGFTLVEEKHLQGEYNLYGFIQSGLNALGWPRDALYEHLKGNQNQNPGLVCQKLLALLGLPFGALFTLLAAIFRKGATVEYLFEKSA